MIHPMLSVIMPVYNCELYVKEAVESILNQTFTDFEFLIIDDKSTDKTVEIIKQFSDSRIQLIEKPVNTGYTNSLNYALKIAKGEYIARMDGDDISMSERFLEQLHVLKSDDKICVCATNFTLIHSNKYIQYPENNDAIKIAMLSFNPIVHPSVMIRKSALNDLEYDVSKEPAEDYDLWTKLIWLGNFYTIQKPLLRYRVHENQISKVKSENQKNKFNLSRLNLIKQINYDQIEFQDEIILKLLNNDVVIKNSHFNLIMRWSKRIIKENDIQLVFPTKEFRLFIKNLILSFIESVYSKNKFNFKRIPCLVYMDFNQLKFIFKAHLKALQK